MSALADGHLGSSGSEASAVHAGFQAEPPVGVRSYERAVGVLFAGLTALAASGPISDNSLLTHIATGRLQSSGGLPTVNPFLTSSSDFPVPSWWWSASLGWAERFAGLGAVRLFTVAVGAVVGWLVVRCSRTIGGPGAPARTALAQVLPAAMVLVILTPWMNARPHLGGFVLLMVALVVWRERYSPWWMVAVFAPWVNVHGSWLYGTAVLGLLWVAEMLDARGFALERIRWLAGIAGGVVLGGIFYPERFRLVLLPTEQFGSSQARTAINAYREWAPAELSSPWVWVFVMVTGLALYGAIRAPRACAGVKEDCGANGTSVRFGSVIAVVALGVLGLSAMRLLPVAAIALAAFAAEGVSVISRLGVPPPAVRRMISGLGMLALVGAGISAWSSPHVDLSRYPVDEVDWLEERNLVATEDVRIIQNDWVGNYLEFRFGEEANVWVDDRPSARTMIDYVTLRGLADGWQETLDRIDPDIVLWQADDPLPKVLVESPEWELALTTDRFRVLCHTRIALSCR